MSVTANYCLYIGNKLYSSWSLRPWFLMKMLGIAFDETVLPLYVPESAGRLQALSPSGKVPVLIDGDAVVWDSLAIAEYLAEMQPHAGVWPANPAARAYARCLCAEMHSGFQALRSSCPMNLGKRFERRFRGHDVDKDVARIEEIFAKTKARFGESGPFLFGEFSAADAMFAPVVTRFKTYSIEAAPPTRRYMEAVLASPSYREWRDAALLETWTLPASEGNDTPLADYRVKPGG